MAKIKAGDVIVVDGLSNSAAKGAMKEIGVPRFALAKKGDAKALKEIKSIAAKWAKKYPCDPECAPGAAPKGDPSKATPKSNAAPKMESTPKAASSKAAPKAERTPKSKAAPSKAPSKTERKPKSKAAPSKAPSKTERTPKSRAAPSKAATPKAERTPKSEAAPSKAAPSKAAPSKAAPSKAAPSKAAPKGERTPSSKATLKAKPNSQPKSRAAKKPKAPSVTADEIKGLQRKLADELASLRVQCPEVKEKLVDDAAAVLATARAVALVSPAVRKARNELMAALKGFAGYETAKAAIAAAEKSVPVQQAKQHVKAVLAEQLTDNEQQVIEDAERDPRVIAARYALTEARTPEAVQKAQRDLAAARDTCRRSARTLRETYGDAIAKLRADMAKQPPVVSDAPIVVPTAEELLFGNGPKTVASARTTS